MSSMYDFVDQEFSAPEQQEFEHANRQNLSKPYVQDKEAQRKADNAPAEAPADHSYYAFWRMFTHQRPLNSFEQSVNIEFKKCEVGHTIYDDRKLEYIELYRRRLKEL